MSAPVQVLIQGSPLPDLTTSAFGPFIVHECADLGEAAALMQRHRYDALLLRAADPAELDALLRWSAWPQALLETAVLLVTPEPAAADLTRLLQQGVQEVVPARDAQTDRLALALRQGTERKWIEAAARRAHAIDLSTGLPNRAQLMEHMTHLLALREREPAPMALLVLRIDGLGAAEARFGAESANVLRRKIAVRLRSGLRASDVVAALGHDRFAVLLAWIDDAAAGGRVAAKLTQSLQRPLSVAGQDLVVAVGVGVARYPGDSRDADALLRLAISQASQGDARGRAGFFDGRPGGPPAANDEGPDQT